MSSRSLGATNPYPLVGPVVFSEIHFRPTNNYAGDPGAGEFLDLLNITSNAVPLFDPAAPTNTWRVAGGIDYSVPTNVTLAAGTSLLLVSFDPIADPTQLGWFRAAYQINTNRLVLGPWSGALSDAGEGIGLFKPDPPQLPTAPDAGFVPQVLVERVCHQPTPPWATNGMGSGNSLQRTVPTNFGNEPLNWFTAPPSAGLGNTADTDGDGLPDYWETQHGFSPTNSLGTNGAAGDFDGDGQTNVQEFWAGTAPDNAAEFLTIKSVVVNGTGLAIGFQAAGGRTYSVLYSDNSPMGPWQKLADAPHSANPAPVTILDENLGPGGRFYRLLAPATGRP